MQVDQYNGCKTVVVVSKSLTNDPSQPIVTGVITTAPLVTRPVLTAVKMAAKKYHPP